MTGRKFDIESVTVRIEELRNLAPGWLDGEGEAIPDGLVDFFGHVMVTLDYLGMPLPAIFPTEDGRLRALKEDDGSKTNGLMSKALQPQAYGVQFADSLMTGPTTHGIATAKNALALGTVTRGNVTAINERSCNIESGIRPSCLKESKCIAERLRALKEDE